MWPNKITPANAGGAFRSAFAVHILGPAWLSSDRWTNQV